MRMGIIPKEDGKGKEGKIIVGPLEAGKAGYGNDGNEEDFDVFDHYR